MGMMNTETANLERLKACLKISGYSTFTISKDGQGTTTLTVSESLWDLEKEQPRIATAMDQMKIDGTHTETKFWFYPSIIFELPEGTFDL